MLLKKKYENKPYRWRDWMQVTNWDKIPLLLDLGNAARILGCTYETARKRCEGKKIPGIKIGKSWRVSKESLREFLNSFRKDA